MQSTRDLRTATAILLGAAVALACESARAVGAGEDDDDSAYPYVGLVALKDALCSGVLLTPTWVVTANHCITGATAWDDCQFWGSGDSPPKTNATEPARLFLSYNPDITGPGDFRHTPARSGPVEVRIPDRVDYCSANDSSKDIALIKLDRRVPLSQVRPMHPGLAGSMPCFAVTSDPNDFTGVLIGYGGDDLLLATPASPIRNRMASGGWDLESTADGWRYINTWDYPFPPPVLGALLPPTDYWYHGAVPRDSGGLLLGFDEQTGLPVPCGIISSSYTELPTAILGVPVTPLRIGTDTAALDSLAALAFLGAHILDAQGRFMGECDEGPLALRDVDSDDDLIPDACDVCPLLPARDATGRNTYDLEGGGPDADGDGVPDACDSCADDPNPRDAATHEQPDHDGDGVGDACDSCPHSDLGGQSDLTCCSVDATCGPGSRCVPVDPQTPYFACYTGRCSRPADTDQDGVGDRCDNCPPSEDGSTKGAANIAQKDADGDGVGDACDDCPGFALGAEPADDNPLCHGDGDCEALQSGSVCVPLHYRYPAGLNPRRCTRGPDSDGDAVGDACDSCVATPNPPEAAGMQPNCNLDAERGLGDPYPYTGDACDPFPCAEADVSLAPPAAPPACAEPPCVTPAVEALSGTWLRVALSPALLPEGHDGALVCTPGAPLDATVGARMCPCKALNPYLSNVTVQNCTSVCPVGFGEYADPQSPWQLIPIRPAASLEAPAPGAPAGFAADAELEGIGLVDPSPDVAAPGFAAAGATTGFGDWYVAETLMAIQGVLWTHTEVPALASPLQLYAERSSHYEIGRFGVGIDLPTSPWLFPIMPWVLERGLVCPQCGLVVDTPSWVFDPATGSLRVQGRDGAIDLTRSAGPDVAGALGLPGVRWVGVAERGGWLGEDDALLAAIAPDGAGVRAVIAARGPTLDSVLGETADPRMTGLSASAPPPRADFGAVLSGREDALFIVGGVLADGTAAGDLWALHPGSATWRALPLTGDLPERVLAATLRPDDRSLHVVDEIGAPGALVARLLRIDLGSLRSTVTGAWTRHPSIDRVDLAGAPRGRILLTGSSRSEQRHMSAVLRVTADEALVEQWASQPGVVAVTPTLTARGLTVPVEAGLGVDVIFLQAASLEPGDGRSPGDCL